MNIFIDLLPESKKEELRKRKIIRSVIFQETFLSFILIVFLASLFSILYILKIQADSLDDYMRQQNSQSRNQELAHYEDKFRLANEDIRAVGKIQGAHLRWSNLVSLLEKSVPEGIKLEELSTSNYKISVSGKANRRENLIAFESNLSQSNCFSNINAPLSNLVSKENIVFQIDFNISEECLKK